MSVKEDGGCNHYEILVVDDNPDTLLIVEKILKQAGYSVTCKESGKETLEAAKSVNFDLILLDIGMPEMDGFEVFRQLKKDPTTKDIPVIFLTIKDEFNYIKKGFELGAADYLTKPFYKFEILARVRPHAELYRLKKTLSER
jgi:DNA-binding response OmpR family regulator